MLHFRRFQDGLEMGFFDKITTKIFEFIYKKQDERHKKRMNSLKKRTLSGKINGESYHTNSAATLTIKNGSQEEKKANQQKIKEILLNSMQNDYDGLFKYIEHSSTKIYKHKFANKILAKIDETEGFILPKKGLKALYLNLIFRHKISFKSPEMFVLRNYNVNIYAFIYQFYNWYCYKMNLSGYEDSAQENFKHVFEICETDKIKTLTYEEILELKGAIKRDVEAIDFVLNFVRETQLAKDKLNQIKDGKKVNF